MSIDSAALANLDRFASAIQSASEMELENAVNASALSYLRDDMLALGSEGPYRAFYAPFDWVNEKADIVIVGITPGRQQALDALRVLRQSLRSGHKLEEAARLAKNSASFKGGMRQLGARLMDHFEFHRLLGLPSTIELFGSAQGRVHYTSALRYPVLKNFANYSGDRNMLRRPMMRQMIENYLAAELASLPDAWIIPFGPNAQLAVDFLAGQGVVKESRILGGILHPGGQQWNRYNVQLDLTSGQAIARVAGGHEVFRRSQMLRAKVQSHLSGSPA